ncbi:MAG: GNAT family N-acetyltransferase [Candidatus Berkiellales bacterium]
MDLNFRIIPISEVYIQSFWAAVDAVARERKYLAFLEGPPIATTYDFVHEHLREGWPHFIALNGEQVIGWCDISSLHRPVYAHTGELGIGVLSAFRGKGIGNQLMSTALNQAKSIGLTRIELTVFEQNKTAIALYQKFGFVVEGLKRKAVKIGENYQNLVCMALLF